MEEVQQSKVIYYLNAEAVTYEVFMASLPNQLIIKSN